MQWEFIITYQSFHHFADLIPKHDHDDEKIGRRGEGEGGGGREYKYNKSH